MAHNVIMGDDDILRIQFEGDIGKEEIEAFLEDYLPYLEAASKENPLRVLALPAIGSNKFSSHARKTLARLNNDPRLGKSATIGVNRYTRVLVSFVLKATGRDNIAFFDTEEEALAWLNSD